MKRKLLIWSAALLSAVLFSQCGKDCAREECDLPPVPTFSFRLVNSNNLDLVVGPAKRWDTADVRITARRNGSAVTEPVRRLFFISKNQAGTVDSIATTGFTVNRNFSTYYLVLNGAVTDSLVFGFAPRTGGCCDLSFYFLSKFNTTDIANGGLPLPITNGYVITK